MSLFSDNAADAVDTLHAEFGDAASFTAPPTAAVAVTVVIAPHDPEIDVPGMQTSRRARGFKVLLRKSQIATRPVPGTDTLTVLAGDHPGALKLKAVGEIPNEWELDCVPA